MSAPDKTPFDFERFRAHGHCYIDDSDQDAWNRYLVQKMQPIHEFMKRLNTGHAGEPTQGTELRQPAKTEEVKELSKHAALLILMTGMEESAEKMIIQLEAEVAADRASWFSYLFKTKGGTRSHPHEEMIAFVRGLKNQMHACVLQLKQEEPIALANPSTPVTKEFEVHCHKIVDTFKPVLLKKRA